MTAQRWPASWDALRAGKGRGMCANQGMEESGWGVRFLQGGYADDPVPGHPLPFDLLDNDRQPEDRLQADVLALRTAVDSLAP